MAFLGHGREIGLRTPVEARKEVQVSQETEVRIVVAQSRQVSFALALFLATVLLAVPVLGTGVYWTVTCILAVTTFLWFLRQASTTSYTRNDGEVVGVAPEEVVVGVLLALFGGFVAFALQKVLAMIGLSVTWPWRYEWLRGTVRALELVAIPVTFSYWAHLELRFSQEAFFASDFIEQALSLLITMVEPPWYVGRRQRQRADPLPQPVTRIEWVERHDNGNPKRTAKMDFPLSREKLQALARHVLSGAAFSEPGLKGILSRPEFVKVRDWGSAPARGFVREVAPDNPRKGVVWTAKGRALLRGFAPEYQKPPPPHRPTLSSQAREASSVNERTNERKENESDKWLVA